MAINVNAANNQAAQLSNDISKLRSARKQMQSYKSSVSNNWQGKEVTYILTAIDQVIGEIDSAIRNMDSLSADIKSVAAQIKREEDAAASRARAAKEQRVQAAQDAYDAACEELETLKEAREKLMDKFLKASVSNKLRILDQIRELEENIQKAEENAQNAYNALKTAKR